MNTKRGFTGLGFIQSLIIVLIILFLSSNLFAKTVKNSDNLINECEATSLSRCMTVDECMQGTKAVFRDKNDACNAGMVCCVVDPDDIILEPGSGVNISDQNPTGP